MNLSLKACRNRPHTHFFAGDNSKPAKVLKDFLKKGDKPAFKGAIVDGALYGADKLDALASMKSKDEVLGDIVGLLLSPIQTVIGGLQLRDLLLPERLKTNR